MRQKRYKRVLMDAVYEQEFETEPSMEPIALDAARLIKRQRERMRLLEGVIRCLGHGKDKIAPHGCWCDHGIGSPMVTRHTGKCERAQSAMRGAMDG